MCAIRERPLSVTGEVDPGAAAALVKSVADIALVVDAQGEILEVSVGTQSLAEALGADWVGKRWAETVTDDTRARLESLLMDKGRQGPGEWRQVAHRGRDGRGVPVQYRVVEADQEGRLLVVGRELQAVASLQQQLVDAQQALERDYWRYRQMETRYRLLFQSVSDAVLIVDASLRRVVEVNPAAVQQLGAPASRLVGLPFPDGFEPDSTAAVESLLGSVLASGRADSVRARRADGQGELVVSVALLRQGDSVLFVVRLRAPPADLGQRSTPEREERLLKAVGAAPDAIVLTDGDGQILAVNRAFLEQVQLPTEHQLQGQSLDLWLGRAGIDLNVLLSTLRQHGTLRLFRTTLRSQLGAVLEAEICAAAVPDGDSPCFAFFIRDIGRRLGRETRDGDGLPLWVGQFTERVGSAPLRDLVRESTELIERLCIEASLKLTGGNRASAAELLGLSRQSLYVKLARYEIGPENPTD